MGDFSVSLSSYGRFCSDRDDILTGPPGKDLARQAVGGRFESHWLLALLFFFRVRKVGVACMARVLTIIKNRLISTSLPIYRTTECRKPQSHIFLSTLFT